MSGPELGAVIWLTVMLLARPVVALVVLVHQYRTDRRRDFDQAVLEQQADLAPDFRRNQMRVLQGGRANEERHRG